VGISSSVTFGLPMTPSRIPSPHVRRESENFFIGRARIHAAGMADGPLRVPVSLKWRFETGQLAPG